MPMPGDRLVDTWEVGPYQLRQWRDRDGRDLFDFTIDGERKGLREMYASLDHALVAAVGEKWTGPRGASGSGVETAAGWFMRMIGAPAGFPAE